MIVEGEEIDEQREDIPGEGCKEEGCPKYYETEGQGRCGVCDCFTTGMSLVGKACPIAVKQGYANHGGSYEQLRDFTDRF